MKTLDEYMQSKAFEQKLDSIENTIEELDIPNNIKIKFKEEIENNKFEIAEYNYGILESDYEDYCYEQHKEDKLYNTTSDWEK